MNFNAPFDTKRTTYEINPNFRRGVRFRRFVRSEAEGLGGNCAACGACGACVLCAEVNFSVGAVAAAALIEIYG